MQNSITIKSYAKLNYTLDVMGRRSDGYHSIATVLQTISLCDTLSITINDRQGFRFTCSDELLPVDSSNLVCRAVEKLLPISKMEIGLDVHLTKNIPSQAGLGGGSSNAARTLIGLNHLIHSNLSEEEIIKLAGEIGSDVPFFIFGGTAAARGRGEDIKRLNDGPPFWFVVVKPTLNVSTRDAYREMDAIPNRVSARSSRKMELALVEGDALKIVSKMTNDFEAAIIPKYPELAALHDDFLMARARIARLCGSGSAMFGLAASKDEANDIARLMRLKYSSVHVCHAIGHDLAQSI